MDMDYKNGKIYKLQCDDGHFYIGSTTTTLVKRFCNHKTTNCKKNPDTRVYKHIDNNWDSVRIVLIEEFPCENKNQLVRKEDEHIRLHREDPFCLNMRVAFRTKEDDKTYYEAHKEELNAKKKAYRETHREDIHAKQKAYRETHKEALDENNKAYYEAHKEELNAKKKVYQQTHREELNAKARARRAALKSTGGSATE